MDTQYLLIEYEMNLRNTLLCVLFWCSAGSTVALTTCFILNIKISTTFAYLLYQTTHWGNLTLYSIINGMSKLVLFGHSVEDITTKLNNGPVDKEILFIRFIDALVSVTIVVYVCLRTYVWLFFRWSPFQLIFKNELHLQLSSFACILLIIR